MPDADFSRRPTTQRFKALSRERPSREQQGLDEATDGYAIFPSNQGRGDEESWAEIEEALLSSDEESLAIRAHGKLVDARRVVLVALTENRGPLVVDDRPAGSEADQESAEEMVAILNELDALIGRPDGVTLYVAATALVVVIHDGMWVSLSEYAPAEMGRVLSQIAKLEEAPNE